MRGIINIVIGIILIIAGLTGTMVLRGTHSGVGLAAVGGVLVLVGIARLARQM